MDDARTPGRRREAGQLRTERLLLRRWRAVDEAALTAISADPEVVRYLNPAAGPYVPRFEAHWREHGFGLWALELLDGEGPLTRGGKALAAGELIGFVGIAYPKFLPAVAHRAEIGWRLARPAWGRGLATEAAIAARDHSLGHLGLPSLISIIHPDNHRSQRVACKLGMSVSGHVHNPVMGIAVEIWSLGG